MSSRWVRETECDRCHLMATTKHHCSGPDDWPKEYQQLHWPSNKTLDLCHDCYHEFKAFMAAKEAERE